MASVAAPSAGAATSASWANGACQPGIIAIGGHSAGTFSARTDRGEPVRNRDRWTVVAIEGDGGLTVSHLAGHGAATTGVSS